MSTQHEWINLSQRTEEVQKLVMQVVELTTMGQKEPESVYREYNWGLVQNAILNTSLLEMRKNGKLQNHIEIMEGRGTNSRDTSGSSGVQEEIDDNINIRLRPQTVVTRDLSWFIQNGESEDIRLKAREKREELLVDLYLEHVKQTGETYFPQLQQLLEAQWRFKFQGDDSA